MVIVGTKNKFEDELVSEEEAKDGPGGIPGVLVSGEDRRIRRAYLRSNPKYVPDAEVSGEEIVPGEGSLEAAPKNELDDEVGEGKMFEGDNVGDAFEELDDEGGKEEELLELVGRNTPL